MIMVYVCMALLALIVAGLLALLVYYSSKEGELEHDRINRVD